MPAAFEGNTVALVAEIKRGRNSVWFRNHIGTIGLGYSLCDSVGAQTLKSLLTGCLVERVQTADTNPASQTRRNNHTHTHKGKGICSTRLKHTCKSCLICIQALCRVKLVADTLRAFSASFI